MNNNKTIKLIFIIIIVASLLFSFNNYTNSGQNLDDQAYVVALGIDNGENESLKISFLISSLESNVDSTFSSSSSDSSKENSHYETHTVESNSIDDAINSTDGYLNRTINLSHCKILLISEDLAKEGISGIVNSLINKVELQADCTIMVSKNISNSPIEISQTLFKYYDTSSDVESGRGYSELVKLSDFHLNYNDYPTHPYATLGLTSLNNAQEQQIDSSKKDENNTNGNSKNESEQINVEINGLAVFNGDKIVGTLTPNETLCHEILINNFNYCTINIPSPFDENESIDLQLSSPKNPSINVKINGSSPFVQSKVYITAKVLSFNSNNNSTLTEDRLNTIKEYTKKYLEDLFYDYFNKTAKEYNSDIAGIGRYGAKNFETIQEWENYKWESNYKNCTFKNEVILSVKSGNILTNE